MRRTRQAFDEQLQELEGRLVEMGIFVASSLASRPSMEVKRAIPDPKTNPLRRVTAMSDRDGSEA